MFFRKQILIESEGESLFLWGARQTGKSVLLKELFPDALWFDLLMGDVYETLLKNPSLLRQRAMLLPAKSVVIVDEIQRLPELLNEIHWLITNKDIRFIMSGSSARKIIRSGANLLGGRALRYELYPLVSQEIPDFDLMRALNHGLLPRHYLAATPTRMISAYVGNYLRDEIVGEAKIRNMQVFAQFLEAAAFSNGEIVNYTNIAQDCGVSSVTIKEYFQILQDTLLGRFVTSFQKKPKRKIVHAPKFYYFDIGIVNHLLKRRNIELGSEQFGNAFEHFIYQELRAHSSYSGLDYEISYWRTVTQVEVDFVLGDHEVAIEVKSSSNVQQRHLRGLKLFGEDYKVKKRIMVCTEPMARLDNGILILPWQEFLSQLWGGEIIG
jgi:predicted AAA+ superfamily ATPase